jgi:hypothetical protein
MAWYYEILGKNEEVVEASEAVYASQFEAQYAAYQRMKEKPSLFAPVPTTGGKVEGGIHSVMVNRIGASHLHWLISRVIEPSEKASPVSISR